MAEVIEWLDKYCKENNLSDEIQADIICMIVKDQIKELGLDKIRMKDGGILTLSL